MTGWRIALTFVCALGSGLIAGVFFGFSSFIMRALGRVPPHQGIAAMQSINIVVINPVFLGVFVGTAVLCTLLALVSLWTWRAPGAGYVLAGSVAYVAGTFMLTMVCNVPLNNRLAAVDPSSTEGAALWATYLTQWTLWNTARTIAALAAAALLTAALWASRS
jgi:uncharacterized membrane protein